MKHKAQALRQVSLFSSLSEDSLTRMAQTAYVGSYLPGQTIIVEGEPCQAVYIIVEGQVRVFRLSVGGREQVLARLGSGQPFNTVPPFQPNGVNHATAAALTPVTLYAIDAQDFRRLVGECPDLALVILQDFARQLDHLTNLVEDLSLRTARARLARFLLKYAEEDVAQRWTQDEIAAELGTVRDTIGRTLRSFADAGLVRMDRQRIALLNREGLETEAQTQT